MEKVLLDAGDIRRTLGRMAHEILEANDGANDLVVVGILRRGWPVAKRLAFLMTQIEGTTVPAAKIDPRPFRDDKAPNAENLTQIPFEVAGKRVILVDEVVFTMRTVRAAMDALVRHGRPQSVQLAALVERSGRELPIVPDFTGRKVTVEPSEKVLVRVHEIDGKDEVVLVTQEDTGA